MLSNAKLLQKLYTSLDSHDYKSMSECYQPDATFHDIAFDLKGKDQIRKMWRMICAGDIQATFEVVHADDECGKVELVDTYTFAETGRKVRNPIQSEFRFKDGLIVEHRDTCDARAWAAAALGGVSGFLAGRFRSLRAWKARRKLENFTPAEPVTVRVERNAQ
jgi:ketosteroid isomerase-like protein